MVNCSRRDPINLDAAITISAALVAKTKSTDFAKPMKKWIKGFLARR
jgi:hypothetical protein